MDQKLNFAEASSRCLEAASDAAEEEAFSIPLTPEAQRGAVVRYTYWLHNNENQKFIGNDGDMTWSWATFAAMYLNIYIQSYIGIPE